MKKLCRARALLIVLIFLPALAQAYAGPGAGFAVLSSFWAIFVAFLYSFYALMTWPFRQLFRFLRRRNAYGKATFERAVILGFDGMDPELADKFIGMYVNKLTLDYGEEGRRAVKELFAHRPRRRSRERVERRRTQRGV